MELRITVSDKVKHVLEQRAAEQGQDIETVMETLAERAIEAAIRLDELLSRMRTEKGLKRDEPLISVPASDFEADMLRFAEGTENLPPYNSTYSREDVYFDHD